MDPDVRGMDAGSFRATWLSLSMHGKRRKVIQICNEDQDVFSVDHREMEVTGICLMWLEKLFTQLGSRN